MLSKIDWCDTASDMVKSQYPHCTQVGSEGLVTGKSRNYCQVLWEGQQPGCYILQSWGGR